ncbi:DUF4192 domain-containing protein [Cellulomonas persica]|uniref:DUF4192 domain-containing protein n=1 Tax=Cellulomonas persica TaxID=76861 RepID=UPI001FEE8798|nr:DUF4192 domain-containing protein [Cellulomonas persica]
MTATTTMRVNEPREIISLLPYRLGFRPRDSAVGVSLRAPRGRVGVVMRVDLPALGDGEVGAQVARAMIATMGRDGAQSTVLVVYTDVDPRLDPGSAAEQVMRAVAHYREAADASLGSVPVWVVTSSGYLSYDCARSCCPPGGRPLRELESTQVSARMVLEGATVAGSRDDLVRIPSADAQRRRVVARTRRRWHERGQQALADGPHALERWRLASVAAWRAAVDLVAGRAELGAPAPWGRLEAGLQDRRVRDAVLASFVPGVGDLPERSVRGARPAPDVEQAMAQVSTRIMGASAGIPAPEGPVRLYEEALEALVAHGRRSAQAPALSLLAVLSWWRGDGARAQILLDRALQDDPAYRLATLLDAALGAGIGPGWARRPDLEDDEDGGPDDAPGPAVG